MTQDLYEIVKSLMDLHTLDQYANHVYEAVEQLESQKRKAEAEGKVFVGYLEAMWQDQQGVSVPEGKLTEGQLPC